MTFVVDAFPVFDHQHLRRLVVYIENLRHLVGKRPVGQQVQVVKVNVSGLLRFLQTLKGYSRNGTTGAVLENNLRLGAGLRDQLFQLLLIGQMNPMHTQIIKLLCGGVSRRGGLHFVDIGVGATILAGSARGDGQCRNEKESQVKKLVFHVFTKGFRQKRIILPDILQKCHKGQSFASCFCKIFRNILL